MKKDAWAGVQNNGGTFTLPSREVGKDVWAVPDARGPSGGAR